MYLINTHFKILFGHSEAKTIYPFLATNSILICSGIYARCAPGTCQGVDNDWFKPE